MTTPIGPETIRPNPALEPLTPLVGEWRTTGTHPLVPGTTLHGRTSFAWHEGGAFLLMRSEIDEPEIPSGVAVIGSDDAAGTFTMIYFDERDISRRYAVEVGDGEVSWHRDEAGFAQRMVLTIAADGARLDAQGTMAHDGGSWEEDLRLADERAELERCGRGGLRPVAQCGRPLAARGARTCQPMRCASETMIPSGPRTYAIRHEPSYSPIPPTNP